MGLALRLAILAKERDNFIPPFRFLFLNGGDTSTSRYCWSWGIASYPGLKEFKATLRVNSKGLGAVSVPLVQGINLDGKEN